MKHEQFVLSRLVRASFFTFCCCCCREFCRQKPFFPIDSIVSFRFQLDEKKKTNGDLAGSDVDTVNFKIHRNKKHDAEMSS